MLRLFTPLIAAAIKQSVIQEIWTSSWRSHAQSSRNRQWWCFACGKFGYIQRVLFKISRASNRSPNPRNPSHSPSVIVPSISGQNIQHKVHAVPRVNRKVNRKSLSVLIDSGATVLAIHQKLVDESCISHPGNSNQQLLVPLDYHFML